MKKEKTILRLLVALTICLAVVIVFAVTSDGKKPDVQADATTTVASTVTPPQPITQQRTTLPPTTQEVTQQQTQESTSQSVSETVTTTDAPVVTETQQAVSSVPSTAEEILAKYTEVMNKAKSEAPGYKKVEYQAIPGDKVNFEGGLFDKALPILSNFFVTEEEARANPEVVDKGSDMYWFPLCRVDKGCMLTDVSKIKSATCTEIGDGNYKIVIVLNDEVNSEPPAEGATSCDSAIGSILTPVQRAEVDYTLENDSTVKFLVKDLDFDLTYYDCTAELVYNPETNQAVSLDQYMHMVLGVKNGKIIGLNAKGTAVIENSLHIYDFVY